MHNFRFRSLFFVFIIGLLSIKTQAQTTSPQPRSPNEHLARSAGAYLGSIEYIRALLASSECKKFLPSKAIPTYKNVFLNEIISAFNKKDRSELTVEFYSLEDEIKTEAKYQVSKIIASVKNDFPSESAACGAIFASINMTNNEAKSKWLIAKNKYGGNL